MNFENPTVVHVATSNIDAHVIVDMLAANGIAANAVEDQSGVSLWMFGRIGQFHKPKVWVDKPNSVEAAQLIRSFETDRVQRGKAAEETTALASEQETGTPSQIEVVCEDCGKSTSFPRTLDGTTQECLHCWAFVDVGDLPWEEDFGEPVD